VKWYSVDEGSVVHLAFVVNGSVSNFHNFPDYKYCDMTPENRNSEVRIDVQC
jgi:hypothetical protein